MNDRENRLRVSCVIDFVGWAAFGIGASWEAGVVRTGDDGIERGHDFDVMLGFWAASIRLFRVEQPYRLGESVMDSLVRWDENPLVRVVEAAANYVPIPVEPTTPETP